MKKLLIVLILLHTITLLSAEKSDSGLSDTAEELEAIASLLHDLDTGVVIPIRPRVQTRPTSPVLTPIALCQNLRTSEDFERLVETMTNQVIENLRTKSTPQQFKNVDHVSIAADIRHGLLIKASEKAAEARTRT